VQKERPLLPAAREPEQVQSAVDVRLDRGVQGRVEDDRGGRVDDNVHLARELGEVLFVEPQRGRVDVPFEHAYLLRDVVIEGVAELPAEPAEGRGAEHVVFEPGGGVSLAGGPDQEVQASQLGEAAQDLLDERRPQEAGPPG
jgi:hypothetical protein